MKVARCPRVKFSVNRSPTMSDDNFGNKKCSLCGKWTRRYVYWGPTHHVKLCAIGCVDHVVRVLELLDKAKETEEIEDA